MPKPTLAPGEHSEVKITRRDSGQWRARCRIGTLAGAKQVEATSSISADDVAAKIEEKLATLATTAVAPVSSEPSTALVARAAPGTLNPTSDRIKPGHGPLLVDWIHVWIETQRGILEDSSLAAYMLQVKNICPGRYATTRAGNGELRRGTIDRSTIWDISYLPLEEITSDDIRRFLTSLMQDGSSRRPELASVVLRRALDEAVVRNFIDANPMTRVDPWLRGKLRALRKGTNRRKPALRGDQADRVTAVLRDWEAHPGSTGNRLGTRLSDAWIIMLGSGVRIGELLALRPCDFDQEAETINVCGTITETPTLMRKPKTKGGDTGTIIPISTGAAEALKRQLAQRPLTASTDTIFTSSRGKIWRPTTYRACFRRALNDAGMDEELTEELGRAITVTSHTARRTVGTWIANSEAGGVMQASKQLRHASSSVTEDFYVDRSAYLPQTRDLLNDL